MIKEEVLMNKKGNWTLAAILGIAGVILIVVPLADKNTSNWWALLGAFFLFLAFLANK